MERPEQDMPYTGRTNPARKNARSGGSGPVLQQSEAAGGAPEQEIPNASDAESERKYARGERGRSA